MHISLVGAVAASQLNVSKIATQPSHQRFGAEVQMKYFEDGKGYKFEDVFVLDGRRTPFAPNGGALKNMTETDLASNVVQGLLQANQVDPSTVKDSLWGNVIQSSSVSPFVSRNAALAGGIPTGSTATTFNKLCGSGLLAIEKGALDVANLMDEGNNFSP
jgi:hypothetical protein